MEEKIIFFDLDGTLVDHEKAAKKAAVEFLRDNSDILHFDENVFAEMWYRLAEEYFELYTKKILTYEEQKQARLKVIWKKMGREITENEAREKYAVFLAFYEKNWELFEDAEICLRELEGRRLGIISNGDFDVQVRKLKVLNVYDRFDIIVTSELVSSAKPDKKIFTEACEKAGIKPHEAAQVGDSLLKDARAAKQAGLRGIWLDRKNDSLGLEAVEVIKTLNELKGII